MMNKLLTLLILFSPTILFSQNKITGNVQDDQNNPVPYATVMLKNSADSSLYKGEITTEAGDFTFEEVKPGEYFLQVQYLGYIPYFSENMSISSEVVNAGTVMLSKGAENLETVTVVAEKPFIEKMADKTVVNVENSIIHAGSSIMQVMEKLPGVLVDQDGNIMIKGKQGVIIAIDGKPTALSGQDLANMLNGMSSENIQKIEIITNPSAKWEAEGNAGIINIIMKKNRIEGYNGSISLGYGQGRYPKYNGAVSFNYKKDWFNLYMSYSYSNRYFFNNLMIDRKYYENDVLKTTYINNNYIILPFSTHTPRLGMDFQLSDKTTVSLLGSGVSNKFNPTNNNTSTIYNMNNNIVGTYEFTNNSDDHIYNYEISTQLNHKLDTSGQAITVYLDYGKYLNDGVENLYSVYSDKLANTISTSNLVNRQIGALSLYSAKVDYTLPITKSFTFEAGAKSSLVESDKDMQFYDRVNQIDYYDSTRSSHFLYSENINAAYINFNKKYEKLTLQAGLRAEHTFAQGEQLLNSQDFDRNYLQVFPTFYINYQVNEKHNVNVNAGRRIDRPHYEQMNPFRRIIDATTSQEGNPYLLPQITYVTELSYSYHNAFFVTLGYNYSEDNILNILIQDPVTETTVQTVSNIDQYNYYSMNVSYANRLTKWWRTNTGITVFYGNYAGIVKDYAIDQGTPSFYLNSNNSFAITDRLSMECNLQYRHKMLYAVTEMKSNYNLSIGVQKSVLKDKGFLTVNLSDVFWTAYPSGRTEFDRVIEDWNSVRDTRVLNVNFSYKFGKGQTGKMRRSTGADEEKRRI